MPTYTYGCKKHGEFDMVRSMRDDVGTCKCPTCSATCKRHYKPQQVVKDTFARDLPMHYESIRDNAKPGDVDTVSSRSEQLRWIKKHNEKYGTALARWDD